MHEKYIALLDPYRSNDRNDVMRKLQNSIRAQIRARCAGFGLLANRLRPNRLCRFANNRTGFAIIEFALAKRVLQFPLMIKNFLRLRSTAALRLDFFIITSLYRSYRYSRRDRFLRIFFHAISLIQCCFELKKT